MYSACCLDQSSFIGERSKPVGGQKLVQFSIHVTSTVPKNIDSYLFISSIFENYNILGKLISNFNIELF